MNTYHVKVRGIDLGHEVPKRLIDFGDFLVTQERGALGFFDALEVSVLTDNWTDQPERLRAAGFGFLKLCDGSTIALLRANGAKPVVLLDSEGAPRTVADSLDQFLLAWTKGKTDIGDLDDDDDEAKNGRKEFAAWLMRQKVKATKVAAPRFDFQAWLDTGNGFATAEPPNAGPPRTPTEAVRKLSARLQAIAPLLGLPATAHRLLNFANEIGLKIPPTTIPTDSRKTSEARKAGLQFKFTHKLLNDRYVPIQKTAKSFVPYLADVTISKAFKEDVLGVPWKAGAKELEQILGPPHAWREQYFVKDDSTVPVWSWLLDEAAEVWLELTWEDELTVRMKVRHTRMLCDYMPRETSLFIAWALERGLIDETRFGNHTALINRIKARQAQGSALLAQAMPRGLWEDRLIPDRLLRNFTYRWFYNLMGHGNFIIPDLIKVFGSRVGPYQHDEPVLDDDPWDAVDRATPVLDERFAPWVKRK